MSALLASPADTERLTHAWPTTTDELEQLAACRSCGRATLRLFVESANWVGRRVETIEFLDDRTVRRRVSVNYVVPHTGLVLRRGSGAPPVSVLPIASLRRKSLINFHFKGPSDRPVPLLGLRENQAVTLALINAWAALALDAGECHDLAPQFTVESNAYRVIKDIIEGDQDELNDAWGVFQGTTAETGPSKTLSESLSDVDRRLLRCLRADPCFGIVLERLAHNWLLLATDAGEPGEHCIVKFSYDEPLTARYSDAGYTPMNRRQRVVLRLHATSLETDGAGDAICLPG